jgi:rare lipoprotein A
MRHVVVFCAITAAIGCGASANELGLASFYGHAGSGELTAAHRSLPFGTQVRVVNLDNGRTAVVKIVDRGPFIRGRIIDVSTATAETLGFREAGLAHVRVDLIAPSLPQGSSGREGRTAMTSPYELCRYGADRAERQQVVVVGAVLASPPPECESLRPRFVVAMQRMADFAPFVAHGGAFLTEAEAAARIPVNAIAAIPAREAPTPRVSEDCGGESGAVGAARARSGLDCAHWRSQLLAFAQKTRTFAALSSREKGLLVGTEAAARIPVTALAEVSEHDAHAGRPATAPRPSNPVLSFFDRLRRLFR